MNGHYILRDGEPVAVDLLTWARWFENSEERLIAVTYLDRDGTVLRGDDLPRHYAVRISTVFLGLDHQWGIGPPILWETMAFVHEPLVITETHVSPETSIDGSQRRYTSRADALAGHADEMAVLQRALASGFALITTGGETHWPEEESESA